MLENIPEQIISRAALALSKSWGLATAFLGIFLFLLASLSSTNIFDDRKILLGFCAFAASIFALVLYKLVRPPVFKPESVGFLLAIRSDSKEAQDRINNDLQEALLNSLKETNSSLPFDVQVLQPFHAANVVSNETATYYALKSKARFVLFGSLTKRKIKSEDHFVLHVEALVTHRPTTEANQTTLSQEMTAVLPLKANIAANHDLEGLELTGRLFGLGAQYVMSVVLFLSGDQKASISALTELNKKLKTSQLAREWPGSKTLKTLAPKRLLDFQLHELDNEYFQWRNDHKSDRLQLIEKTFNNLPEQWKNDPRYLSSRAVCHFVLHNNVAAARDLIKKIGSIAPQYPTWRYSLAFLDAYEGDIPKAKSEYLRAFRFDTTQTTALEVEEFLAWTIESDSSKVQLLFFLGFINFHRKKDYTSAARDFAAFIESSHSGRFPDLIQEAKDMIRTCNEKAS